VPDVSERVKAIRSSAAAAAFWDGNLDAVDVTEHLIDVADAKARIERTTMQAPPLLDLALRRRRAADSIPGVGPVTACIIRGSLADGTPFCVRESGRPAMWG
jgi:hypothetical protein